MKRTTVASLWSGTAGILIILLGIIHSLGVKEPYRYGFDKLPSLMWRAFEYMYLGVGVVWIFVGLLLVVCGRGLRRGTAWAWPLGMASAVLMLLFGVGAMVLMPDNPPAPFILGCALLTAVPFLLHRPSSHARSEGAGASR